MDAEVAILCMRMLSRIVINQGVIIETLSTLKVDKKSAELLFKYGESEIDAGMQMFKNFGGKSKDDPDA